PVPSPLFFSSHEPTASIANVRHSRTRSWVAASLREDCVPPPVNGKISTDIPFSRTRTNVTVFCADTMKTTNTNIFFLTAFYCPEQSSKNEVNFSLRIRNNQRCCSLCNGFF